MTSPAAAYAGSSAYGVGQQAPTVALNPGLLTDIRQLNIRHGREAIVRQLERADTALKVVTGDEYKTAFGDAVYQAIIGGYLAHSSSKGSSPVAKIIREGEQDEDEHIHTLAHEIRQKAYDELQRKYGDKADEKIAEFVREYEQIARVDGKRHGWFVRDRYGAVLAELKAQKLPNWTLLSPTSTGVTLLE